MPPSGIYLSNERYQQLNGDLFEADSRGVIADEWQRQATAALPDMVAEEQRKAEQQAQSQRDAMADQFLASVQTDPGLAAHLGGEPAPQETPQTAPTDAMAAQVAPAVPTAPEPAPAAPEVPRTQSTPTAPVTAPMSPASGWETVARAAAQKYGIDPDIFARQIGQESNFNPTARSAAGAIGIAQFMPATAQSMGIDPTDPHQALDGAARLMAQHLQTYGGDYGKALAAYNAGPGNVDKYGGVPPFAETQQYVSNILGGVKQAAAGAVQAVQTAVRDPGSILEAVKPFLGQAYVWGGKGPQQGFDCLVEGTLITTQRGEVPIERIRPGDWVQTRRGLRPVLWLSLVREDAELWSAELDDGRQLIGTGDHRVWTENRGWVGLSTLQLWDILATCRSSAMCEKSRSLKASATTATPSHPKTATANISSGRGSHSTSRFGSPSMVRSRKGTKFTTATMTRSTTTSATSNVSHSPNTVANRRIAELTTSSHAPSAARSSPRSQRNQVPTSTIAASFVSSGGTGGPGVSLERARSVAPHSWPANTKSGVAALSHAPAVKVRSVGSVPQRGRVYDLAVDDAHEFFANGILVHNCSGLAGFLAGTGQPESTTSLYAKSTPISARDAQPGDLVFYNMGQSDMSLQHVGTVLDPTAGTIVQSGGNQARVNIGSVDQAIGSPPEFRRLGPGGAPAQAAVAPAQTGLADQTMASTSAPQGILDRLQQIGPTIGSAISDAFSNLFGNLGPGAGVLAQGQQAQGRGLTQAADLTAQTVGGALEATGTDPNAGPIGLTRGAVQSVVRPAAGALADSGLNTARREYYPNITEPGHVLNPATPLDENAAIMLGGMVSPMAVQGMSRFYHGTGSDFARPDAAKFDPNGLFGPGYYLTDSPVVASSYAGQRSNWQLGGSLRDNVRAVDVPQNLNLLNVDAPLDQSAVDAITNAVHPADADQIRGEMARLPSWAQPTNQVIYDKLRGTVGAEQTNGVLARAGFDGIQYNGGRRIPMQDAAGQNIEHTAVNIFPQSIDKLRNAISGTQGGQIAPQFATALGGAAAGGGTAAANTDENDPNRILKIAGGALAGGVAGYGAGRVLGSTTGQTFLRDTSGEVRMPGAAEPATTAETAVVTEPHGLTINLPKYVPDEVRGIIQQAYDAHPEIMDAARRGVIPDEVVRDLAAQTGTNAGRIANLWKPGQAKNAETILALRQSLADQSQLVLTAQQAVRADPTKFDAQQQLVQALTRHAAVQEVVTGVTAEAGRALRQFRQPIEGANQTIESLQQLAKRWKVSPEEFGAAIAKVDLSDPVAVAGVARSLVHHTPADYLSALWYFNLLSSPLSHVRNVVSNSVVAAIAPLESVPSAAFDVARSAIKGAPRERFFGELGAQYVGFGAGMREGMVNGLQILAHGYSDAQAAGQLTGTGAAREVFSGPLGAVINTPGRALGAEDAFFRTMNKTGSLYAQAYRLASQEGLKGQALIDRVTELRRAPTLDMLKEAESVGAFRIFQEDSELANKLRGLPAWSRFFVPFIRTPINIVKYAMQYSPIGFGTLGIDAVRGGAGTAGQIEDRLARASMGTAILGGLSLWAQDGNLTGPMPDTPTERDAFLREHPAYSMKIGDHWYSYQALQPFSSLFAAVAAVHQSQEKGMRLEPAAAGTLVAFAVAKSITDMPWLQGLTQALEAQHNPQQMAGAYTEQVARSLAFPTAFWGWVNRATDNMLRSPQNPGQAFVGQFPGLTGMQPTRLTAFGQEVQRPPEQMGTLGALNPFNPAPVKDDPVDKALADLQLHGYTVEPGFVGKQQTVPKLGVQVELTNDENRQVQKVSGQLAYSILLPVVTNPAWSKLTPEARAKIIDDVISKSRDYARKQLLPELVPRGIAAFNQEYATGIRKPAPKPAGVP